MKLTKAKLKEIIREELINEADFSKVQVPSRVKRFMGRFVDGIKGSNLNRIKRTAILFNIIDALGITPQELQMYIAKIKRGLKDD